jgi:hypothetical protein
VLHEEAAKAGVRPGAMQDVGWFGFKNVEGKPMYHWLNEAIERTYRLTGMPRRKIVEGVIKKTVPLFSVVGAVLAEQMGQMGGGEIPDQQSAQE